MDSGLIRVMPNESSLHTIPQATPQLNLQQQQEVYHLNWGNGQILVNEMPLKKGFSDLCRPIQMKEDDKLPESVGGLVGDIENFEDPQESDEVQPDIPALIKCLETQPNEHDESSSQGNIGTPRRAGVQQKEDFQPLNQNIISFNVYDDFNFTHLQHALWDATVVNIFNTLGYPSFHQQQCEIANAPPRRSQPRRSQPKAAKLAKAKSPQTGAFSTFFKNISVHRNNPYPETNLETDNSSIFPLYEEPDIKNVVFPGPFSPLNRYINNNPVMRTDTNETDAPANIFFKFNPSLQELCEENSDLGEMFRQAKRVSLAKARGTSKPRRRGRPVSRPPTYSTTPTSEKPDSCNIARCTRSQKKLTMTKPGPVTRSQMRRLRTA